MFLCLLQNSLSFLLGAILFILDSSSESPEFLRLFFLLFVKRPVDVFVKSVRVSYVWRFAFCSRMPLLLLLHTCTNFTTFFLPLANLAFPVVGQPDPFLYFRRIPSQGATRHSGLTFLRRSTSPPRLSYLFFWIGLS